MSGTRRRILLATLVAAVTSTLAAPAPARPVHTPRTLLAPLTDQRGPNPRVAYYDRRSHRLHDGRRSIPVRFPGALTQLAAVRGGYVVANTLPDVDARTTSASSTGTAARGWSGTAGSPTSPPCPPTAAGRLLHGWGAPHVGGPGGRREDRLAAVHRRWRRGRARPGPRPGRRRRAHRVVDPAHRTGSPHYADDEAYAADLSARRVALLQGDTSLTYVGSFPRGSLPQWRLPDTERVARFSGTDRRVLTLGHQDRRPHQQLHAAAAAQHPHRRRTTDVPRSPRPRAGPALGGRADVPRPGQGPAPAGRHDPRGVAAVHDRRPVRAGQPGVHAGRADRRAVPAGARDAAHRLSRLTAVVPGRGHRRPAARVTPDRHPLTSRPVRRRRRSGSSCLPMPAPSADRRPHHRPHRPRRP